VAHVLVQLVIVAGAVLIGLLAVQVTNRILRVVGRRIKFVLLLTRRAHRPFQATVVFAALDLALRQSDLTGHWRSALTHVLNLGIIASSAWLLTALLFVTEETALSRFRTDVRDNRTARTVRTQVNLARRATAVAVTVIAIITILVTFRQVRIIGTSLLASAGVVAAVAGFAAQAVLGNVIAGLQLAFGKSLRLDDVVVVEHEWGRIEAITLTYVVVHIWDDRRLIFPTSYFTSTPFQNWTRSEASLLGSVEFELDWNVPVEEMREEVRNVLAETHLWDGRIGVLQVTDAVCRIVRLRALVSAPDAPSLWDLRCLVRERLILWLRHNYPESLPRQRVEMTSPPPLHHGPPMHEESHGEEEGSRVFGGDAEGRERGHTFQGPGTVETDEAGEMPVEAAPPDGRERMPHINPDSKPATRGPK
jgi:small-conductance mechanosensitive channel